MVVRRGEEYVRIEVLSEIVGGKSVGDVVTKVLSAGRESFRQGERVTLTQREERQARWVLEGKLSSADGEKPVDNEATP